LPISSIESDTILRRGKFFFNTDAPQDRFAANSRFSYLSLVVGSPNNTHERRASLFSPFAFAFTAISPIVNALLGSNRPEHLDIHHALIARGRHA
jgi:hypothetical protein